VFVTYSPEDGTPQSWEFDPDRVKQSEGEMCEKRFGGNWSEFVTGVQAGSLKARKVLLWHLLRRQHPMLRFEDVPDFLTGELKVEHSVTELTEVRDRVLKADLDDATRGQVLAGVDIALTDALAREGLDSETDVDAGKAPSKKSA
jgi:hypothetical protein